jgi:hypothetical protein
VYQQELRAGSKVPRCPKQRRHSLTKLVHGRGRNTANKNSERERSSSLSALRVASHLGLIVSSEPQSQSIARRSATRSYVYRLSEDPPLSLPSSKSLSFLERVCHFSNASTASTVILASGLLQ